MRAEMEKKNVTANAADEVMLAKDERENLLAFGISIVLGIVACVMAGIIFPRLAPNSFAILGTLLASMSWGGTCLTDASVVLLIAHWIILAVKGQDSKNIGMYDKILLGATVVGILLFVTVAFTYNAFYR